MRGSHDAVHRDGTIDAKVLELHRVGRLIAFQLLLAAVRKRRDSS